MGSYDDSKIRKARKARKCGSCGAAIAVGDQYLDFAAGLRNHWSRCLACAPSMHCAASLSLASNPRVDLAGASPAQVQRAGGGAGA